MVLAKVKGYTGTEMKGRAQWRSALLLYMLIYADKLYQKL